MNTYNYQPTAIVELLLLLPYFPSLSKPFIMDYNKRFVDKWRNSTEMKESF